MQFLQKKIKGQCQQSCILILLAVTGDQQQEQHHQKISCIKIFWKKLF